MGLEVIVGLIVAAPAAVADALGLGKSRGTSAAEAKMNRQHTGEHIATIEAVTEHRVETTEGTRDVQQTISHLPDYDADCELHERSIHEA